MTPEPDPALRASDADRDTTVARLREAHAEGRLTADEFEERVGAVLAARTMGELTALTADLPTPGRPVARTGDEAEAGRREGRPTEVERSHGSLRAAWGTWATAVLVSSVIWFVSGFSGGWHHFWPVWVAGPWGAVLLARTLFGPRSRP
jgi:hypothetical protein